MGTIVFPNCRWDTSALELAKKYRYEKIIALDSLPKHRKYHSKEFEWKHTQNIQKYLKKLSSVYGRYYITDLDTCVYFFKYNMYYYYNTTKIKILPTYTIYIKGFIDRNVANKYRNNKIIISCDTIVDIDRTYEVYCCCDQQKCQWD